MMFARHRKKPEEERSGSRLERSVSKWERTRTPKNMDPNSRRNGGGETELRGTRSLRRLDPKPSRYRGKELESHR
ncbi:hypothetical protein NDU88_001282 [Pleurodeles waltl]|uniref:Uncharacterized protein n=1 Tax=Pleurodeles waltl TaxID=8319 RepID=A0AAV7U7G3_PLEWA|nr:hypothetical protein NDU88_001282 [Pleurodeles waltl]